MCLLHTNYTELTMYKYVVDYILNYVQVCIVRAKDIGHLKSRVARLDAP